MSVKIGNIRTFVPDGSIAIKVDRTSVLGNPYVMPDETFRDTVCDWYDDHFYDTVDSLAFYHISFKNELNRIIEIARTNDVTLLCWCAPKRCHAETIKRYIERKLEESVNE